MHGTAWLQAVEAEVALKAFTTRDYIAASNYIDGDDDNNKHKHNNSSPSQLPPSITSSAWPLSSALVASSFSDTPSSGPLFSSRPDSRQSNRATERYCADHMVWRGLRE
mgnify:CR=1 FL=1